VSPLPGAGAGGTASLYDVIGGHDAVVALVERFYGRLATDPTVEHLFPAETLQRVKSQQVQYIGRLLGGPEEYDGPDLAAAHAHLAIADAQVEAVLGHLRASMLDLGVDEDPARRVMAVVSRLWFARNW
jgi:hemoglobin